MSIEPTHPWRLATNERYLEVVRTLIGLSTGSLVIPVFFLRDVLGVGQSASLLSALDAFAFASWACLVVAIFSGIAFHYFSAKWVRIAWGQPAGLFRKDISEKTVECVMDWTFCITAGGFVFGVGFLVAFFANHVPAP
jgi:hypothetical protein